MRLRKVDIPVERQGGSGRGGEFYLGDARDRLPLLLEKYAGQAQLIYLDPPFLTGEQFSMRVRVGAKDWRGATGSLALPAYADNDSAEDYLAMMREVLTGAKKLLSPTGTLFLHIDYRMSARLRLMADELFGAENLLNEIIWSYQTGGRAKRYFSRKHDTILFYRNSRRYYFNIEAAPIPRGENRRNHMKRHVDTDGRVYRSIRSGGKIYTYYDDEPAYPGDVWDDVSHLQQKDPQRTGYDTQKPYALLERIINCASRPGDLVMDLFAGSGTTLDAAWRLDRRFVGVDSSRMAAFAIRRRMTGAAMRYELAPCEGDPRVDAMMYNGIAYYDVEMRAFLPEQGASARAFADMDALDNWSVGYVRGGAFESMATMLRDRRNPTLSGALQLPVYEGERVLRVGDVLGRDFYYIMDEDGASN